MSGYRTCLESVVVDREEAPVAWVEDAEHGLRAGVVPACGAELASLQVRRGNEWVELLYRALDYSPAEGWPGRAPLLWPAVGRTFTEPQQEEIRRTGVEQLIGTWVDGDMVRPIPRHGFAKDRPWELIESSSDEQAARATLRLRSDAFTREMYPFDFEMLMTAEVSGGVLRMIHRVESHTDGMFWDAANHLSLRMPFGGEGGFDELVFTTPATQQLTINDLSLFDGGSLPVDARGGVSLGDPRWHNTVLSGFPKGEYWAEVRDPKSFTLRVSQTLEPADKVAPEWMLFVLWGEPSMNLFCPEPWVGGPNSFNTREGLVTLAKGEVGTWTMGVEAKG